MYFHVDDSKIYIKLHINNLCEFKSILYDIMTRNKIEIANIIVKSTYQRNEKSTINEKFNTISDRKDKKKNIYHHQ